MAEKIGLTADGIKYHLSNMQEKKLIKRIGPDKGGYWKIIADQDLDSQLNNG